MPPLCSCGLPAFTKWRGEQLCCKACFSRLFEDAVMAEVRRFDMLPQGRRVAVGCSGGKDSAALLHCLYVLNNRESLGVELVMVAVDEGIAGYRDLSLDCVRSQRDRYGVQLVIRSFEEFAGIDLDGITAASGTCRGACTVCGVLRRFCLNDGALGAACNLIATGHNGDDCAETVVMNLLRGDALRLVRNAPGATEDMSHIIGEKNIPRVKPFRTVTQREVILYASANDLKYFSVECPHSALAFRAYPRQFAVHAAHAVPRAVLNMVKCGEILAGAAPPSTVVPAACARCGSVCTESAGGSVVCAACRLIEQLRNGDTAALTD